MKEEIINNLGNPRQLEKLYRDNKTTFRKAFNLIYPEIQDNPAAQIWNERLNFENQEISWGPANDLIFVIAASLFAGLIAKIPAFTNIQEEFFYPRNTAFIIFPFLTAYFFRKQKDQTKKLPAILALFFISAAYINLLPDNSKSDTLLLACIHLPLFLWTVLGYTFTGSHFKNYQKRVEFLRYNGNLVVMATLILIAGAILTGITIGLFSLINIEIREFYFNYIVVGGLAASPIVATYLVHTNPQLVNRISPVIAKIFTPLVLITLVVYLIAVIVTGKDPYNDRNFLFIFNMLLIGVMAIILFSIAGTSKEYNSKTGTILLLGLSIVTIIVNGIVLSAILLRISEWGITPNRLAVLGGNMIILANLCFVSYRLLKSVNDINEKVNVEKSIASFLPVYSLWTMIVTFIFPLIFHFK